MPLPNCKLIYQDWGVPTNYTFPEPLEYTGNKILMISGSGYSKTGDNKKIGIRVKIGTQVKARCCVWASTGNQHMAFVPAFMPVHLASGSHTLTIETDPDYPASALSNESFFSVAIAELDQSAGR